MKKDLHEDKLRSFFDVLTIELEAREILADEKTKFAIARQRERSKKKASLTSEGLIEKAYNNFLVINNAMETPRLDVPLDIIDNARSFILRALENYTTSLTDAVQTPLDLDILFDLWRFGPGASNGITGTHTAEKIGKPMTCTVKALPFVSRIRRTNPYFISYDRDNGYGCRIIEGSRLSTVPKNEDTVRTIAIEPSGNMAMQLAAGVYLEGALRYVGLDIKDQQEKNKALAAVGSLEDSFCTIDLKNASDMISIPLVRALFPKEWFSLFCSLRSEITEIPGHGLVRLNMMSTMGNGFTFPMMTLIFVSLIYGLYATSDGSRFLDWSKVCVFGDDIIVEKRMFSPLVEILSQAGFVVNTMKSYSDGPFRESCGGDYYKGFLVTPFYIKSLSSDHDVYVAINQLLDWCVRVGVLLFRSLSYLRNLLRSKVYLVPEWCSPDSGVRYSGCPRRYKYLSPQPRRRRLVFTDFALMLVVGGYLEGTGPDFVFIPRCESPMYTVRKGRLPKGFLSGWGPSFGSQWHDDIRSLLVESMSI